MITHFLCMGRSFQNIKVVVFYIEMKADVLESFCIWCKSNCFSKYAIPKIEKNVSKPDNSRFLNGRFKKDFHKVGALGNSPYASFKNPSLSRALDKGHH
jgi:hypothetical protein